MKLDRAAIVLRPRGVAEVVDLAFRLTFSLALPLYAKLSAIVLLPVLAGLLALRYALKWEWYAVWLLAIAAANLAQGVFTVAAGRLIFSEDLRVRDVLSAFGRRLPSYLLALVASRVVLAVALLPVLALPFAWVALMFVHEASLLEGAGAVQACQRASRFVSGRGAQAFGLLALLLAGQCGAVLIGELLGQGLLDDVLQLGRPFGSALRDGGSPFALAGLFASVPFVATARFLQYIDTRTRADGWDIQVRFLALNAKDAEERKLAA